MSSGDGTNSALLQATACGNFVMAFHNVFNRDVLGETGVYYTADKTQWALNSVHDLSSCRNRAQQRIKERYSWDHIADEYKRVFLEIHRGNHLWHFNWHTLRQAYSDSLPISALSGFG